MQVHDTAVDSPDRAGKVTDLVATLALPRPPPREVAIWTIAHCDELCEALGPPTKINTKSLRETCEMVRDAVELHSPLICAAAALRPLDACERSTMRPIASSAISKYFFVLGMSIDIQLGCDLVRVAPSPVEGLGVFAVTDIPKHTCFTAYPSHLLALWEDGPHADHRVTAIFSRKHANYDVDANRKMRQVLWDYGLEMCGVTVYGDPASHSPGACGHMINDPRGTTSEANCVVCPLVGGALVGIVTLRQVSKGEELFLNYGERGATL